MSGTIFIISLTSANSTYSAALRQLDQQHQNDGEKDARTRRREKDRGKVKVDDDEPVSISSSTAESDCVEKPGDTQCTEDIQDAASSSQGWQKDAVLDVGTRKLVASRNSETEGSDKVWPHSLQQTTIYVLRIEKVFLDRETKIWQMKDLDVNTALWGRFMSVTLQAAVHLGKDYREILRSTKNQPKKSLRQLFQVTERLITDQRDYWTDNDWLAAACVERDNSADWESCSVCNCQNLRLFRLSAMSGRYQYWTSQSMGKQD